jgi:hypothetical protein
MYYVCMFICVCMLKSALFGSWRGNPDGDSCNDEADYQRRSMPPIQPTFQLMIFPFIVCYMSIKQINTYYIYNVSILCAYIYICVCVFQYSIISTYFHLIPTTYRRCFEGDSLCRSRRLSPGERRSNMAGKSASNMSGN